MLFVGRVHPEKGVHLLIDAFTDDARNLFAEWKLMIVGPEEERLGGGGESYLASLKHSAERANNRVTFTGPIFDAVELEQTFRGAKLFIYPSLAERGESFGLAPLEAMTHGCAVLVSSLDCFQDFIRDRETGFVFDHRSKSSVETLRKKMEKIIGDETLLARVADAGYRKSADYSIGRVADRFLDDFNLLIGRSHAGTTNR
jgi:glycosyltransferase involved in cell wall biosynthesis